MRKCRENTAPQPLSRLDFMARSSAFPVAVALAAAMALGLVACGGGDADLLPGDTAGQITSNLDLVEQLASEGDCTGASDAAQAVSLQVEELGGIDPKLRRALREGATRLNEVVVECEETTTEEEVAPAIEDAEEPPEEDEKEKGKAEKPQKAEKEAVEPDEEETDPGLPPQAEGEAKGHEEQEEVPPTESGGTPSGGVGPATPAEGE